MIVEVATFRYEGDGFAELDAEYQQSVVYQAPGLVRRTTARGDDGSWVVVTLWESAEHAIAPAPDGVVDLDVRRYETLD